MAIQCSNGHYCAGHDALVPSSLRDESNERIFNSSYQGTYKEWTRLGRSTLYKILPIFNCITEQTIKHQVFVLC